MITEEFNIYKKVYSEGARVTFTNKETGKSRLYKYHHNDKFFYILNKNMSIKNIHSYIEKYPNIHKINTIILDFDGEIKVKVKNEIDKISNYLTLYNINHYVIDSTNKGYHLYILLGENYDFGLSQNFNTNNDLFKKFTKKLIHYGCYYLDEANIGLKTNIRLIGSIHPKTGKIVKVVHSYYNDTPNNDYANKIYNELKNSITEIRYKGRWKKINTFKDEQKKPLIDLRTLNWDKITNNDGKSFWCICPFHDDNKPSLRVYEKSAYCQVCGKIPFNNIKEYFNL